MESDSTLPWLFFVVSLVAFWFASLGEAGVASVRREHVQRLVAEKVRGSRALEALFSSPIGPSYTLSLLKIVFLASGVLSAAAVAISYWGGSWWMISLAGLVALALIVVAHTAAFDLSSARGERIALRAAPLAWRLDRVIRPVLSMEASALRRLFSAAGGQADSDPDAVSGEMGISDEANGKPLDEREARMIRGVVRLDQTTAREIMLPRGDMLAVELGTPLSELVEQMVDSGHSRVPVYSGSLDSVEGIAYSRDILGLLSRNERTLGTLTAEVIRPALFIPEAKNLEELLNEFQERQVHIAIVVDEYGGVSGLVTIEDLLEEIVGEINDEFDVDEPQVEVVGEREFLLDARLSLDQLGELLHVNVEGDGFDTVGGFVYHSLGKIPSSGDAVEYDGLRIEVVSTVGRRLKKLRVTRAATDHDVAAG